MAASAVRGSAIPASAIAAGANSAPQRVLVLRCAELCWLEGASPEVPRSETHGPASSAPDREAAQAVERVIAAVAAFCPKVEVVEPGVCAFGARGPARYFGGETALAGKIIAAVANLGVESRVGVADGLFAALLAARGGSPILLVPQGGTAGVLAGPPVSVPEDPDLAGLLQRLGLRTLRDLAALPASDVGSRFGDAGEAAHRLARGLDSPPLVARPPAECLAVSQRVGPPHALAP